MSYAEKSQLRRVLWQYIIDHSTVKPNGYIFVYFYCKDQEDFWRRVTARTLGFKRYDVEHKEQLMLKKANIYEKHVERERLETLWRERTEALVKGKINERVALWIYRKTRAYLFGKIK